MKVSVQESRLFGLFIVATDSSDLVDYDMVTGEMIVLFMNNIVVFKVYSFFNVYIS